MRVRAEVCIEYRFVSSVYFILMRWHRLPPLPWGRFMVSETSRFVWFIYFAYCHFAQVSCKCMPSVCVCMWVWAICLLGSSCSLSAQRLIKIIIFLCAHEQRHPQFLYARPSPSITHFIHFNRWAMYLSFSSSTLPEEDTWGRGRRYYIHIYALSIFVASWAV